MERPGEFLRLLGEYFLLEVGMPLLPAHYTDIPFVRNQNISMDLEYPGMARKKIIEGNTRGAGTTRDEYAAASAGDTPVPVKPIFAIIKLWPPKWQLDELAAKRVST